MTTRRQFLRSSTAMIALPALPSLGYRAFAATAEEPQPPRRLVVLGFGWGVTEETWYPDIKQPGPDYELPKGLEPLANHKADFSIVQGLWNKFSNEGHWGSTMWLTGANRYAQPGQSFHNSVSFDQVAAAQLGLKTRFASLQLNGAESRLDGSGHGPGLSLAWDSRGKPVAGQNGPLEAYHRLFSKDTTPINIARQCSLSAGACSIPSWKTPTTCGADSGSAIRKSSTNTSRESATSKLDSASKSNGLASPHPGRRCHNRRVNSKAAKRSRSCTT